MPTSRIEIKKILANDEAKCNAFNAEQELNKYSIEVYDPPLEDGETREPTLVFVGRKAHEHVRLSRAGRVQ